LIELVSGEIVARYHASSRSVAVTRQTPSTSTVYCRDARDADTAQPSFSHSRITAWWPNGSTISSSVTLGVVLIVGVGTDESIGAGPMSGSAP
jgi:hypothetical protein